MAAAQATAKTLRTHDDLTSILNPRTIDNKPALFFLKRAVARPLAFQSPANRLPYTLTVRTRDQEIKRFWNVSEKPVYCDSSAKAEMSLVLSGKAGSPFREVLRYCHTLSVSLWNRYVGSQSHSEGFAFHEKYSHVHPLILDGVMQWNKSFAFDGNVEWKESEGFSLVCAYRKRHEAVRNVLKGWNGFRSPARGAKPYKLAKLEKLAEENEQVLISSPTAGFEIPESMQKLFFSELLEALEGAEDWRLHAIRRYRDYLSANKLSRVALHNMPLYTMTNDEFAYFTTKAEQEIPGVDGLLVEDHGHYYSFSCIGLHNKTRTSHLVGYVLKLMEQTGVTCFDLPYYDKKSEPNFGKIEITTQALSDLKKKLSDFRIKEENRVGYEGQVRSYVPENDDERHMVRAIRMLFSTAHHCAAYMNDNLLSAASEFSPQRLFVDNFEYGDAGMVPSKTVALFTQFGLLAELKKLKTFWPVFHGYHNRFNAEELKDILQKDAGLLSSLQEDLKLEDKDNQMPFYKTVCAVIDVDLSAVSREGLDANDIIRTFRNLGKTNENMLFVESPNPLQRTAKLILKISLAEATETHARSFLSGDKSRLTELLKVFAYRYGIPFAYLCAMDISASGMNDAFLTPSYYHAVYQFVQSSGGLCLTKDILNFLSLCLDEIMLEEWAKVGSWGSRAEKTLTRYTYAFLLRQLGIAVPKKSSAYKAALSSAFNEKGIFGKKLFGLSVGGNTLTTEQRTENMNAAIEIARTMLKAVLCVPNMTLEVHDQLKGGYASPAKLSNFIKHTAHTYIPENTIRKFLNDIESTGWLTTTESAKLGYQCARRAIADDKLKAIHEEIFAAKMAARRTVHVDRKLEVKTLDEVLDDLKYEWPLQEGMTYAATPHWVGRLAKHGVPVEEITALIWDHTWSKNTQVEDVHSRVKSLYKRCRIARKESKVETSQRLQEQLAWRVGKGLEYAGITIKVYKRSLDEFAISNLKSPHDWSNRFQVEAFNRACLMQRKVMDLTAKHDHVIKTDWGYDAVSFDAAGHVCSVHERTYELRDHRQLSYGYLSPEIGKKVIAPVPDPKPFEIKPKELRQKTSLVSILFAKNNKKWCEYSQLLALDEIESWLMQNAEKEGITKVEITAEASEKTGIQEKFNLDPSRPVIPKFANISLVEKDEVRSAPKTAIEIDAAEGRKDENKQERRRKRLPLRMSMQIGLEDGTMEQLEMLFGANDQSTGSRKSWINQVTEGPGWDVAECG